MCVMVLCSKGRLPSILEKLRELDIHHMYFYNTEEPRRLGVPFLSLLPFANLLVCEDCVEDSAGLHERIILGEARRMSIPVLTETTLTGIHAG